MLVKPNLVNVRELPGPGVSLDDVKDRSSLELMEEDAERLPADERYRLYQHRDSSWSHNGDWGENAVRNLNAFFQIIRRSPQFFEDDVFCDFGGNDGTVAEAWRAATGNAVYSVDLDRLKQGWGRRSYPEVNFINAILEDVPLDDGSVDWAFCSHTLEHVADLNAAMDSITRIVNKGLFVVVPLENPSQFWKAEPHMRGTPDPLDWLRALRRPEWRLAGWCKPWGMFISPEMHMLYLKDASGIKSVDYNKLFLDDTFEVELEGRCT